MKYTGWSEATLNESDVIVSLLACLKQKHYAWIELQQNGDQAHPIKIKNPELLKHSNWTMLYGVPTENKKKLWDEDFFNETEKDLTLNYKAAFGDPIKKIDKGMGICFPLKKKGSYNDYWTYYWQPKDNIPYWIPAKLKKKVYVVVYDDSKAITDKQVLPLFKKAINNLELKGK